MTFAQRVAECFTHRRRNRLGEIKAWRWFARNMRSARKGGRVSLCIERNIHGGVIRISVKPVLPRR